MLQDIRWDGLVVVQDFRLFLKYGFEQMGPLSQRLLWIDLDRDPHPPANGPEQHRLGRGFVHGHEPCGEALVPADEAEARANVVAAGRDVPRDAGTEVVVHADAEYGAALGGTRYCVHLSGAAVPRIDQTVRVTYGLDVTVSQVRKLPA